jgi:hypothetical protein
VAPAIQNLEQQNAALQQGLARETRQRLDAQVAQAVPDYQEIDRDPRWHQFLLGVDPLTGQVRQSLLNDAIAAGRLYSVVAMFQAFRRQSLGEAQAPSAAGSRSRRPSSGKRTYTPAQIGELYRRHQAGEFVGREKDWEAQEKDFYDAQKENRIVMHAYISK